MPALFRPNPLAATLLNYQFEITTFSVTSAGTTITVLPPRAQRLAILVLYTRGSSSLLRSISSADSVQVLGSSAWNVFPVALYPWLVNGATFADAPTSTQTIRILDQWVAV